MKKLYSRSGSRGLLEGGRAIALVLALVVVLLLVLRLLFPAALTSAARPLWAIGDTLTGAVGSASLSFENADEVREERDRLRQELIAKANEYETLRAQLTDVGRLGETGGRIVAGVLARPPVSPYDTLVLGKGTKDGVRTGAQAYGQGGIPLGLVERADEGTAHVSLYSSAGRETYGWAGEARTPVTLVGAGSGAFRATLPKDTPVAVGEMVYVPGPGALPIGTIVRIDTNPSSPTASVFIQPAVNPFSLSSVSIALP